jgi:hypothetical protein
MGDCFGIPDRYKITPHGRRVKSNRRYAVFRFGFAVCISVKACELDIHSVFLALLSEEVQYIIEAFALQSENLSRSRLFPLCHASHGRGSGLANLPCAPLKYLAPK